MYYIIMCLNLVKDQYEKYGEEFQSMVYEALRAIGNGVYPVMIPQGSSGSYFVMNMNRVPISFFLRLFLCANNNSFYM